MGMGMGMGMGMAMRMGMREFSAIFTGSNHESAKRSPTRKQPDQAIERLGLCVCAHQRQRRPVVEFESAARGV